MAVKTREIVKVVDEKVGMHDWPRCTGRWRSRDRLIVTHQNGQGHPRTYCVPDILRPRGWKAFLRESAGPMYVHPIGDATRCVR